MSRQQNKDVWRRPELFFADLLKKEATRDYVTRDEHLVVWHRAVVEAVDVKGGKLENPQGAGSVKHKMGKKEIEFNASIGPTNPKNSVKARIISEGFDQFFDDDSLRVFWPMFPENDSIPVKPGEHIYVTFEDSNFEHGLWLGKVSGHENLNYYRGQDSYKPINSLKLASAFGDEPESDENEQITDVDASERFVTSDKNKLFGD